VVNLVGKGDLDNELAVLDLLLVNGGESLVLVVGSLELNEAKALGAAVALGHNVSSGRVEALEDLVQTLVVNGEGQVGNKESGGRLSAGNSGSSGGLSAGSARGAGNVSVLASGSGGTTGSSSTTATATTETTATTASSGSGSILTVLGNLNVDFATVKLLLVHESNGLVSLSLSGELHEAIAQRARATSDNVGREDIASGREGLLELTLAGLEGQIADEHLEGGGGGDCGSRSRDSSGGGGHI
jgi:hypothetical protein